MGYADQWRMTSLLQTTGFDWPTALAFGVMALVYFLAPWVGYRPRSRGLILAALWVLLAKVGVGMLRMGGVFLALVGTSFKGKDGETLFVVINVLEAGAFLLSLVLFVIGLPLLRREEVAPALPGRGRGFEDRG
jgi:hypothetical protein